MKFECLMASRRFKASVERVESKNTSTEYLIVVARRRWPRKEDYEDIGDRDNSIKEAGNQDSHIHFLGEGNENKLLLL